MLKLYVYPPGNVSFAQEVLYLRPYEAQVAELQARIKQLEDPARPHSPVAPADFAKRSERKVNSLYNSTRDSLTL